MAFLTECEWAKRCGADGEFLISARHWRGGLTLTIGTTTRSICVDDGKVKAGLNSGSGTLEFIGSLDTWRKILAAVPERFHNDLTAKRVFDNELRFVGDPILSAQYYSAVMRAIELLRPESEVGTKVPVEVNQHGCVGAPVGRYINLELQGHTYRIYYEETGEGIPLLLQHTAGCHGSQWRHLFEIPELTSQFRLIAYDLPYHGKSLPPVDVEWWATPYSLRGEFLRSIPVKLSEVLNLHRPVFMGCSVGGLLALDLAHKHPACFRAVIAIEGALKINGDSNDADFGYLWHPQVSNEYKARLMDGLMAPHSPKAYRRETSFVYACGWPPAFLGDLFYYSVEYDLTKHATEIDTDVIGVHIMSGEYDYSGTVELGREAHEAITGSTFVEMKEVGHFPMSENPKVFISYLQPILSEIANS